MKTNSIYKIFLEEVLSSEVRFNIFPSKVSEVSVIPKNMAYFDFSEKCVVSSSSLDLIKLYSFGVIISLPEYLEEDYEENFIRICLRSDFHNKIVLPAETALKSLQYNKVKGFISSEITQEEKVDLNSTIIKIRGKLAVYSEG